MKFSFPFCMLLVIVQAFRVNHSFAQPGNASRMIKLNADDTASIAPAPAGFDQKRENILRGRIDSVQYESTTVGVKRKLLIYTPPGFSPKNKYPVLYLMHGIGGDEKEWFKYSSPNIIFDNLYADKKIVPMIVVFPNGRAMKYDSAGGNIFDLTKIKAFTDFTNDLLNDIIPFIEKNYPVKKDRESRAIAGFSMGGGQSLNIGLRHMNEFAWVGGFSSAPNTEMPAKLVPDPAETSKKIKVLYLSCGNKDGLMFISQGFHKYLKQNHVPHVWEVINGGHDIKVWTNDLYLFTQMIYR